MENTYYGETQQRFTAYLSETIRNTKINYLRKKARIQSMELSMGQVMDEDSRLPNGKACYFEFDTQFEEHIIEKLSHWQEQMGKEQLISISLTIRT